MGGMGEVLHNTIGFAGASCKENMGRRAPMIFAAVFTVRWRVLQLVSTLNGSPVEGGEDGWRETCSFQPAEKV